MEVSKVFPRETQHPRQYMTLAATEFADLPKQQMGVGPTLTSGHNGTIVWYSDGEVRGYIVQVNFDRYSSEYFLLPCSFEPKFGIDQFDGMLIQDAETFSVMQRLGWKSDRLDVFGGKETIETRLYLEKRTGGMSKQESAERAAQANDAFRVASGILMPLLQKSDSRAITSSETASLRRANELLARVLELSPQNSSAMWLSGVEWKGVSIFKPARRGTAIFHQGCGNNP